MCKKNNAIVAISSGGGHLTELLLILDQTRFSVDFIITDDEYVKHNEEGGYLTIINFHRSARYFFVNALQAFKLALRTRPSYVITTGAGIVVPFCLISKALFGAKIINIETGSRFTTSSITFQALYYFSYRSIVRTKLQQEKFPKSKARSL